MSDRTRIDHGFYRVNDATQKALDGSAWLVGVGIGYEGFKLGLQDALEKTKATSGGYPHKKLKTKDALLKMKLMFRKSHDKGRRVIVIGNGGSSAIASHIATDYTKNAGIRTIAFNDSPTITCMANDFGYPEVFAKQLEYYAHKDDIAVLISSSGKSHNILNAAVKAMDMKMQIITFTGMLESNPLRGYGDINFWVPSGDYGLVEITHLSLLHSITSIVSANL